MAKLFLFAVRGDVQPEDKGLGRNQSSLTFLLQIISIDEKETGCIIIVLDAAVKVDS